MCKVDMPGKAAGASGRCCGQPACTTQKLGYHLHCLGEQSNSLKLACMQRPALPGAAASTWVAHLKEQLGFPQAVACDAWRSISCICVTGQR